MMVRFTKNTDNRYGLGFYYTGDTAELEPAHAHKAIEYGYAIELDHLSDLESMSMRELRTLARAQKVKMASSKAQIIANIRAA
jgi:hypothetical protein